MRTVKKPAMIDEHVQLDKYADMPELHVDSSDDEEDNPEACGEVKEQQQPVKPAVKPTLSDGDTEKSLFRNFKLSPRAATNMQRIAKKLHLKFKHTGITQLIQIAPDHKALEELLDFPTDFEMDPCLTCLLSKSKAHKMPRMTPSRAPYPNFRWFMDLTGKMRIKSWTGKQYGGVIVDDTSNEIQGLTVAKKNQQRQEYDRVCRFVGVYPKKLQTDGACENINAEFVNHIQSQGTHHEKSAVNWQNQNARAEAAIYRVSIQSACEGATRQHPFGHLGRVLALLLPQ